MAKVTSKYQVTVPKAVADQYGIRPGDDIEWVPAGDVIRVIPSRSAGEADEAESRLRVFDQATARQRRRIATKTKGLESDRGWTRGDLYNRGRSR